MNSTNRTIAGTLLFLAVGLLPRAAEAGSRPAVGQAAPDVSAKEWLNAEEAPTLAGLRGKIVVVEFWATWCPPCRASIPHLVKLHEDYKDKGVVVIGLTSEDRKKAKIDAFAKRMKMTYIVGTGSRSNSAYGVRGIPSAFLVDPEGKVLWSGHPMGGLDTAIEEAVKKFPDAAKPAEKGEEKKAEPVDPVRAAAEPILANLLAGLKGNSYSRFSRDFDEKMKKSIPDEEAFRTRASQIWRTLGDSKSHVYLGSLKKGEATLVLWKASFTKTTDDVLVKLVLSKKDEKKLVSGLWFE